MMKILTQKMLGAQGLAGLVHFERSSRLPLFRCGHGRITASHRAPRNRQSTEESISWQIAIGEDDFRRPVRRFDRPRPGALQLATFTRARPFQHALPSGSVRQDFLQPAYHFSRR